MGWGVRAVPERVAHEIRKSQDVRAVPERVIRRICHNVGRVRMGPSIAPALNTDYYVLAPVFCAPSAPTFAHKLHAKA